MVRRGPGTTGHGGVALRQRDDGVARPAQHDDGPPGDARPGAPGRARAVARRVRSPRDRVRARRARCPHAGSCGDGPPLAERRDPPDRRDGAARVRHSRPVSDRPSGLQRRPHRCGPRATRGRCAHSRAGRPRALRRPAFRAPAREHRERALEDRHRRPSRGRRLRQHARLAAVNSPRCLAGAATRRVRRARARRG